MKKLVIVIAIMCSLLLAAGCSHKPATAATPAGVDKQEAQLSERIRMASQDLDALMNAPDSGIPEEILGRARCVAVIPDMVKGGFVIGGQHGRGMATCRRAGGWTAPIPITLTGGSWGAQIGVESADVVLVFMNDHALQDLLSDKIKLGADAAVAAGPVGRHAEAGTNIRMDAQILSYSRTKGLFAGLTLNGAKVAQDMDTTVALYGKQIPYTQIAEGQVQTPPAAAPFISSVRKNFREAAVAARD